MKQVRAQVRIRGRVQGVGFRFFTHSTAEKYGLTGWVRNLPDGDVEAVFEGRETDVKTVVDWCRRGPSGARVDDLSIEWREATDEFREFRILR